MELEKGITQNGSGYQGVSWNILGQVYYPKAVCADTFAFETNSDPGQFVPVHIHPNQDEFILVQEGELDLKLDGQWTKAKAGDLVRMPGACRMVISTSPTSLAARSSGSRRPESWSSFSSASTR